MSSIQTPKNQKSFFTALWVKSILILIFFLFYNTPGFSQDSESIKEISEAIENAKSGKYEQAIPILRKHAEDKEFDHLNTLSINVYLNWSYLKTNIDSINIGRVNYLTHNYILKNGISKTDSALSLEEIKLIYTAASINQSVGKFEIMISFLLSIKDHYEKLNIIPNYNLLLSLAEGYRDKKEYNLAIEFGLEAWSLNLKSNGERNHASLIILDLLNYAYEKTNQLEKALECQEKITEIGKHVLGEMNPIYLETLHRLGEDYFNIGQNSKALEVISNVVELRKKVLGERSKDYLNSLNNLAGIYAKMGEFDKGFEINIELVELSKDVLEENNPVYLNRLSSLAEGYKFFGDYQNSIKINLTIVQIYKENLGEKHLDYIVALKNLGESYSLGGEYLKAYETKLRACDLTKGILGEKHPEYIYSLANLAVAYSNLGQNQAALELKIKAVELAQEVFNEQSPDFLTLLSNLALGYQKVGDYQKAIEISNKVKELGKLVFGEKDLVYLTNLSNLSLIYIALEDYQKALDISLEVWEQRKELLGEKHPDYLQSLTILERIYYGLGDYETSLNTSIYIVKLTKEVLGENHPYYMNRLNNISLTEFRLNNYDNAISYFFEMLIRIRDLAVKNISLMTENQRKQFWEANDNYFYPMPIFIEKVNQDLETYLEYAYDFSLFTKGLLLNTNLEFEKLISEKGSNESIAKYKELKTFRLQIQKLYEKPIAERYLNVDSLETVAQKLETELVNLSKEYGDYTQNLKITWKDVQASLGDNDVAIEFLEYPTLTDTVKYAALVLRKGWENPKFVPLFRKDQVDEFLKRDPNQIYSNSFIGKEIRKLVWSPLEEFISPGDKVHFSAAGMLHQLAVENLSYDESTTLGDRYQMFRLSSTKELALKKPESNNQSVALYGGIKYDLELDQMIAGSKKYDKTDTFLAVRGIDQDSFTRKGWQFLPGTLAEANAVSQILNKNRYQISEYIGETGSEESFKDLSGKRTGIIHIATHGFFLPVEQSKRNPFIQMRFDGQNDNAGYVDPMLRSGLLLAGGNWAWQGDSIPDTIEDGVLTAKEISHLDLRETDLVVLSACETGLGDVSSEGVFGLQRAFKQAGAQTIIMSLWNVKDEATQYLMTNFYSFLMQGDSKREAFIQARNKCQEQYPDPASWAAFIMLD